MSPVHTWTLAAGGQRYFWCLRSKVIAHVTRRNSLHYPLVQCANRLLGLSAESIRPTKDGVKGIMRSEQIGLNNSECSQQYTSFNGKS